MFARSTSVLCIQLVNKSVKIPVDFFNIVFQIKIVLTLFIFYVRQVSCRHPGARVLFLFFLKAPHVATVSHFSLLKSWLCSYSWGEQHFAIGIMWTQDHISYPHCCKLLVDSEIFLGLVLLRQRAYKQNIPITLGHWHFEIYHLWK